MSELKPCPFCGGEAELLRSVPNKEGRVWWRVVCKSEECFASYSNFWHMLPDEATTAWNTRAVRTCAQKRTGRFWLMSGLPVFMCSNCGETFDENSANNYCPNCGAKVVE